MPRRRWILALALAALSLSACIGKSQMPEPDADTDALAHRAVERVQRGDVEAFRQLMHPEVRETATESRLDELRVRLGENVTMENVSYQWSRMHALSERERPATLFVTAEYQLHSSMGYFLMTLKLKGPEGALAIEGINVQPLPGELKTLNAWRLAGRPPRGYLLLTLALAIPAFIVYALYRCARSGVRRKWLWLLFVAFGLGRLSINWTTGEWDYQVLHLLLLGGGVMKLGDHGPWILSVSFPLGALLFLLKLRRMRRQAEQEARLVAVGLAASAAAAAPTTSGTEASAPGEARPE